MENGWMRIGNGLPTEEWLSRVIWPAERRWTASEVEEWAGRGMMLMAARGCTAINDHYFFAEQVARAALKVGLRAFIGQTVMDTGEGPCVDPEEGFRFYARWKRKNHLITPTLAPHATNTVSPVLMGEIAELAVDEGAIVHIHLSQSRTEVREVMNRYGVRPVEYLRLKGVLDTRLIAAHGIYLTEGEARMLRGSSLVICPTSNLTLEGRLAPIEFLEGVNLTVGTDFPSPMDPFIEMRRLMETAGIEPVDVLRMATLDGARALGIRSGLIKAGYNADLVIVSSYGGSRSYGSILRNLTGEDVEATVVGGELIYERGERKNF